MRRLSFVWFVSVIVVGIILESAGYFHHRQSSYDFARGSPGLFWTQVLAVMMLVLSAPASLALGFFPLFRPPKIAALGFFGALLVVLIALPVHFFINPGFSELILRGFMGH